MMFDQICVSNQAEAEQMRAVDVISQDFKIPKIRRHHQDDISETFWLGFGILSLFVLNTYGRKTLIRPCIMFAGI